MMWPVATWLLVAAFITLPSESQQQDSCSKEWIPGNGCEGIDCKVIYTYNSADDTIDFSLQANVNADRWLGIGFSNDMAMPNSDMVMGYLRGNGELRLEDRWAAGRLSPRHDTKDDLSLKSGQRENGRLNLKFTRKRNTNDPTEDLAFSDSTCYYFLFAVGTVGGNGDFQFHSQRHISPNKICIQSGCRVELGNGGWGEWQKQTSECNAQCGGGTRRVNEIRVCISPGPVNCQGSSFRSLGIQTCNNQPCTDKNVTISGLATTTVNVGGTIRLTATVNLQGQVSQWFVNNVLIQPGRTELTVNGNQHMLVIKGARLTDQGNYTIKIGIAELSAFVQVNQIVSTVQFAELLRNQTVTEGQMLQLSAVVNLPNQSAKWYFNGNLITGGTASSTVVGSVHTLSVPNAALSNSGEYSLEVGSARSSAVIQVKPKPAQRAVCNNVLDVILIIDGSQSIFLSIFENKLKPSLIQLAVDLVKPPKDIYVGWVLYSTTISSMQNLTNDAMVLNKSLSDMVYPDDGTSTGLAIKKAIEVVEQSGRPGAPRVMILITDGASNDKAFTLQNAGEAKNKSFTVYAFGVGELIDLAELNQIASTISDVVISENFDALGEKLDNLTQQCFPVAGGWSSWVTYSTTPCSCSTNTQTSSRYRNCTNPAPEHGGADCVGFPTGVVTIACTPTSCRVNGGWGTWGSWTISTACNVTCGNGSEEITRIRLCNQPSPQNGGLPCPGSDRESDTRMCTRTACPVDGGWSGWGFWVTGGQCNVTCGNGFQQRVRQRFCINPEPQFSGKNCIGEQSQTQPIPCSRGLCAQWTEWTVVVDSCTVTCGGGTRGIRKRRQCVGIGSCPGFGFETLTEVCSRQSCPSEWGAWGSFVRSTCSPVCGNGVRKVSRTRTCVGLSTTGIPCQGSASESFTESCTNGACAEWTAWTVAADACSASCGGGIRNVRKRRQCIGIGSCPGLGFETDTEACGTQPCPRWLPWVRDTIGPCSLTCDDGTGLNGTRTVTYQRSCESSGGCVGKFTEDRQEACTSTMQCPAPQPPPVYGLCMTARNVSGIGYRYHPINCDKYIQCYYNPDGKVIAVYRSCPFGHYWDQTLLRCNDAYKVKCPMDRCADKCVSTFNMDGSCQAYWSCENGKAEALCCGNGYSYVLGKGCREDISCHEPCPTACVGRAACDKRPVWNDTSKYELNYGLLGWNPSSCHGNGYFDLLECGCSLPAIKVCKPEFALSFSDPAALSTAIGSWLKLEGVNVTGNVAVFSESGRLMTNVKMTEAAVGCPIVIRFKYRENSVIKMRQILASSSDCHRGYSMVIAAEKDQVVFELRSWYGIMTQMPVSTAGFTPSDWKQVTFVYNGKTLTGTVEAGNYKYISRVSAPEITVLECGLDFGSNDSLRTFTGDMDEIALYRCDPDRPVQ